MADNNDLIGTGALSLAVVALARGLEFIVTKWRQPAPDPTPSRSITDRLTALEIAVAHLQAADLALKDRHVQLLEWLERLDSKLDQVMMRQQEHGVGPPGPRTRR
jgi:hypothetical protein